MERIDLTNQKKHNLTAIRPTNQRTKQKLIIWECLCDCGNTTFISSNNFGKTKSCGCIFKNMGIKSRADFKYDIGDVIKDKNRNIIIISKLRNPQKSYQYKCNICSYESNITEYNLNRGERCAACAGKKVVIGFNDIPTTAPWMVKYFQGGYDEAKQYTFGSSKSIHPICSDCHKIKTTSMKINVIFREKSIGCRCGDGKSYPEKFMYNVLNQLNIEFIWGYRPEWLIGYKNSRWRAEFDFYIPSHNVIVEIDGGLGHGLYAHTRSNKTKEETLDKDKWKDAMAEKNGITVVRIPALESTLSYMQKSITSIFNIYFNLQDINWNICDKYATKNIIKEICTYYEQHKPITSNDLSLIFPYHSGTILRYLRKGKANGWCNYELKERIALASKKRCKPIDVYYINNYIGYYESASDLQRKSIRDLGVQLYAAAIWRVLNNKASHHKKYTFKYCNTN